MRAVAVTFALVGIGILVAPAHGSTRGPWSQRQIVGIIDRSFADDRARAECVADHESDGTPHHFTAVAMNGSNTGLFQIDERTWNPAVNPRALPIVGAISWGRMLEPAYNAMVARRIYLYARRTTGNGWGPWSTRHLCGA